MSAVWREMRCRARHQISHAEVFPFRPVYVRKTNSNMHTAAPTSKPMPLDAFNSCVWDAWINAKGSVLWKLQALHDMCCHFMTTCGPEFLCRKAVQYAESIMKSGGLLRRCVGFLQGVRNPTARPCGRDLNQCIEYSKHRRIHCLYYQTVTTADSLNFHLNGPVTGRQPYVYL